MTRSDRLDQTVGAEGMIWGNDVAQEYHGVAATHMDVQWMQYIQPFLDKYAFDLNSSIDFAAGFGRNTRKLFEAGAGHVTMVDVNPDCVEVLKRNFEGEKGTVLRNNGYSLEGIPDQSATFFYSFDAMVHFDMEIIISYIPEIARVLSVNGFALIHHSNYSDNPGGDFRSNPHYRNYMTKDIVKHVAVRSNLEVIEQRELNWGELNLDCISILKKR